GRERSARRGREELDRVSRRTRDADRLQVKRRGQRGAGRHRVKGQELLLDVSASEVAGGAGVVVLTRGEFAAPVQEAEAQRPPPFGGRGQRERVWPWPDLDERVLHLFTALGRAPHR